MELPCLCFSVAEGIAVASLPDIAKDFVFFSCWTQAEVTISVRSSQPQHLWQFVSKRQPALTHQSDESTSWHTVTRQEIGRKSSFCLDSGSHKHYSSRTEGFSVHLHTRPWESFATRHFRMGISLASLSSALSWLKNTVTSSRM